MVFTAGKSGKIPYGRIKKYFRENSTLVSTGTSTNSSTGTDTKVENLQFYYHPDHLGSSSYITDASGEVYQHDEYFPFGETFVEERTDAEYTSYLFNGKELDQETGLYYYGARYYDPRISMWYGVDPMADKYPSMSPFAYVANNPIKAIDSDGRDIIVLNNPNGASGYGHMGVLIGNDKTGWTFISKEGRDKTPWYSNMLTGGPAAKPVISAFKTKAAFDKARSEKGSEYKGYTQEVKFKTSEKQDKSAASATEKAAKSWYNVLFNNCADAVSKGLEAAGLDPGYKTVGTSIDDNLISTGQDIKTLNPRPTERFEQIVKNNNQHIVNDNKKTENNSQSQTLK